MCINTGEIAFPGDEWKKRVYFHHTTYPSGASWTLAHELHNKDRTLIMQKAISRGLGNNLQRRFTMKRLHLFADDIVPKEILENVTNQIRQLRPVPQRLDKMNPDVVKNFPKIMDYPAEFVPKKIQE